MQGRGKKLFTIRGRGVGSLALITALAAIVGAALVLLFPSFRPGRIAQANADFYPGLNTPVDADVASLFVDTGVLFEETLETRDRMIEEYGLNIVTLAPEQTMADQTAELGVLYLSVDGQKQCCDLRKTQPLLKVADEYDALLGSLRRSDGGNRAACPILAVDSATNTLRVNPMVNISNGMSTQSTPSVDFATESFVPGAMTVRMTVYATFEIE